MDSCMRPVLYFFLLSIFLFSFTRGTHPIYVSVTEMELNAKEKRLEISCKLFTDDFEKTLRSIYKTHVDLINPASRPAMDKLVTEYVQAHLKLTADAVPLKLKYLGYEVIEEGVYCYFEVPGITGLHSLNISNDLLYDLSPQQMGLMHLTVNGERKSTKLVNPDNRAIIHF